MKIPKIEISYSNIYDIAWSKAKTIKLSKQRQINGYNYAINLQKAWVKNARKILSYMSELTGLKWHRNEIDATVSFNAPYSFSHPLTIYIYDIQFGIVNLVHELCHILLWANKNKVRWPESKDGIYRKYKNETYITKLHLPVHAIVILVIKKIYGRNSEKYLSKERWWEIWPRDKRIRGEDYFRSWKIVEKEGPKKILKSVIK